MGTIVRSYIRSASSRSQKRISDFNGSIYSIVTYCFIQKNTSIYQSSNNAMHLSFSVRQSGKYPAYSSGTLWPPFRLPIATHPNYEDPRKLLLSRTFHAILFVLLYKATHAPALVSEQSLALVIYLLDMAVSLIHQSKTQGNVSLDISFFFFFF